MVIKSFAVQAAGALINALLSFVLLIWLARSLGTEAFGNYSVLLNAGVIALVAMEGGYPILVYRETAAISETAKPWRGRFLSISLGWMILAALVVALVPVGFLFGQGFVAWWAVVVCMALVAWMNTYSGYLRGQGRFVTEAGWQVAGRVFVMGGILVALALEASSVTVLFFAWSLGLMLLLLFAKQHWPPKPDFELALPVRQAALHLTLGQLLFTGLMRVDLLALATVGGDATQTALYSAAARFAEVGFLLFAPVLNLLQLGLRQRQADRAKFLWYLTVLVLGAVAFAAVGMLVGGMAADWLVTLAFGNSFAEAAPLLAWLLGGLVLMLPGQVLAQAAVALNRERAVWVAYAAGLLLTLVGAMVLVPGYGALGTAWAMLIGHGGVLLVLGVFMGKHFCHSGKENLT